MLLLYKQKERQRLGGPVWGATDAQREDPTVTSHSLNLRLAQCVASGLLMITAAKTSDGDTKPVRVNRL